MKRALIFVLLALFPLTVLMAGDTGKIIGKVVDSKTGEVLAGVNVILQGTSYGAATDSEGEFLILFVPPGLYTVKLSYIGFTALNVENVRITKDLTTNLYTSSDTYTIGMSQETIKGESVTVFAAKPLIEINATNEVRVTRAEDIQNMAIRGFSAVAALQTGVVADGSDLHVRGGRTDEVGYYIDGIYVNNPYSAYARAGSAAGDGVDAVGQQTAPMEIPQSSLEEVSFQAGGFNAEYGQANAGIVSTTTKEGRDNFKASFETLTDAFLPTSGKDQVAYSYGFNVLSGSFSGKVPLVKGLHYALSGELKNMDDAIPSWNYHPVYVGKLNDQTGRPDNAEPFVDANDNGVWDRVSDIGTPGRGPVAPAEEFTDLNNNGLYDPFFIKGEDIEYQYGPLPNNGSERVMITGNIVADLKQFIGLPFKFKMGGSLFQDNRIAYIHGRSLFNYYDDNGTMKLRFPKQDSQTSTMYGRLTGALSERTYFSIQLSRYLDEYEEYDPVYGVGTGQFLYDDGTASDQFPYMQHGKRYDYVNEQWINPLLPTAGTNPTLADSVAQFQYAGRVFDDYTRTEMGYTGLVASLTHQLGNHEFKVGVDYKDYTVRFYRIAAPMRLASTMQTNPPYSPAQKDSLLSFAMAGIDSLDFNGNWYESWPRWDDNYDSVITTDEYQDYFDNTMENAFINAYAENIGYDITGRDYLDSGDNGARKPIIAAVFFQDKLELSDLIVNFGIRFDYIDPDNLRFNPDTGGPLNIIINQEGQLADRVYLMDTNESGDADAEDFYRSATPTEFDDVGKLQRIKSPVRKLWSPRLGLAFPVTDRTVFHAQYGKFIQQPEMNRTFISYSRFIANMVQGNYTTSQNPELQPVVTTQYEFGFKQLITKDMSVDMTMFYKQMSGYVQIRNVTDVPGGAYPINYAIFTNGDYGSVKGLSFAYNLRRIKRIQLTANYTLQYAGGTGSNSNRMFTIAWQSGNYPTFVSPLDYDQRHTASFIIDYRTSAKDRIPLFGVNMVLEYGSGMRYTPSAIRSEVFNDSDPSIPTAAMHSGILPATIKANLQVDKSFLVGGVQLNAYLQVQNLFDFELVREVYAGTGEPGNDNWLTTAEGQSVWVDNYGETLGTALYDAMNSHPYRWGAPRQIRLGIRVNL